MIIEENEEWNREDVLKSMMFGIDVPVEDIFKMVMSTVSDIIVDLRSIRHNQKTFYTAIQHLLEQNGEEKLLQSVSVNVGKNNMEEKKDE